MRAMRMINLKLIVNGFRKLLTRLTFEEEKRISVIFRTEKFLWSYIFKILFALKNGICQIIKKTDYDRIQRIFFKIM